MSTTMEFTIEYPPQLVRLCSVAIVTAAVGALTSSSVVGFIVGVGTALALS